MSLQERSGKRKLKGDEDGGREVVDGGCTVDVEGTVVDALTVVLEEGSVDVDVTIVVAEVGLTEEGVDDGRNVGEGEGG